MQTRVRALDDEARGLRAQAAELRPAAMQASATGTANPMNGLLGRVRRITMWDPGRGATEPNVCLK
jgi:hypothetical protein